MKKLLLIVLLLTGFRIYATHIVGGEMIYDFLGKDGSGNDIYRITLKIYRDCLNGQADFDGVESANGSPPAIITVLEGSGKLVDVYNIGKPVITVIPPTINKPCVQVPNTICVEEGVYTYTLTLPPKEGGYYVVYQRCCRNNTVLNLFQSGKQGSTYFTKIPGPEDAVNNSSPRFNHFPAIFLCNGLSYTFDHSATDPDGDQLIYSFSAPFEGIDGCCTYVGNTFVPTSPSVNCPIPPASCPQSAPPPPYPPVTFISPYTGSYPVASNPSLTINSFTGKLGGKPNLMGQFVVGVCVEEYRAGKLINRHFRDFQYNIVPCTGVSSDFEEPFKCQGNTFTFNNQSFNGSEFHWDFGVPGINNDTSNLFSPTYTYADTGKYTVTLIADRHKPCSDTVKKTIRVFPPLDVKFPPAARQCFKTNSFDFNVVGSYTSSTTFSWNLSAGANPPTALVRDPKKVVFNEPGKYFVKLFAMHYSCIDSFIDSVRVLKEPVAKILDPVGNFCSPASIRLRNASSGDEPLQYLWRFSTGKTSTEWEPVSVFSPSGTHMATLIAVSHGMCLDTAEKELIVYPDPEANFIPTPSVTSIFDAFIEVKNMSLGELLTCRYSYGDYPELTYADYHIYQDYGNYTITQYVTNGFGCTDSISKIVKVLPEYRFWIPNCFTPDNNSLNDLFMPIIFGVSNYEFEIFNRWGQRIFRTSDPQEGWNGSFKGEECQQDVYSWKISFKNMVDNETILRFGHVTLIRNP